MSESLSNRLEEIKKAAAQKAEIEAAHEEALKENKKYDEAQAEVAKAQTEAEKEDALRTELKALDMQFTVVEGEAKDAAAASAEAKVMLADVGLGEEERQAIRAIVEEAEQKIVEFGELQKRKQDLENEINISNKPTTEAQAAPDSPEATAHERIRLIEKIEAEFAEEAKKIQERAGKVDTVDGRRITIEEAIKNGEAIEFNLNMYVVQENINAIVEAGLVKPEEVINELAKEDPGSGRLLEILEKVSPETTAKLEKNPRFSKVVKLCADYYNQLLNSQNSEYKVAALMHLRGLRNNFRQMMEIEGVENDRYKNTAVRDEIQNKLKDYPNFAGRDIFRSRWPNTAELAFSSGWFDRSALLNSLKETYRNYEDLARMTIALRDAKAITEEEAKEILGV